MTTNTKRPDSERDCTVKIEVFSIVLGKNGKGIESTQVYHGFKTWMKGFKGEIPIGSMIDKAKRLPSKPDTIQVQLNVNPDQSCGYDTDIAYFKVQPTALAKPKRT